MQNLTECEDIMLNRAEQQLVGYVHGRDGYSLRSLVQSMGMTKKEWETIKVNESVYGLHGSEIKEVNEYFKKEK